MSTQPTMEVRMAHLEGAYEQISDRLNGVEHRMERGFAAIDQRFIAIEQKIDKHFLWLVGLILVSIILPMVGRYAPH